jgi:hypothetical protein
MAPHQQLHRVCTEVFHAYITTAVTLPILDTTYGLQVLENWYPTPEEGKDKGVLLVVTSGKEGAISGGKNFMTVSDTDTPHGCHTG